MIAAPILMIIDPRFVPGPLLVLAFALSFMVSIRERHHIDWYGLSVSTGGRIAGSLLAAITLTAIPLELYKLIFGILVLIAVYLRYSGLHTPTSAPYLVGAGVASGYMGTLTSIGAPPIALAYHSHPPDVIRSTLSMFFVIGAGLSLLILWFFGDFNLEQAGLGLGFVPALFVGFWASSWVITNAKVDQIQNAILLLSTLAAVILIFMALFTLV